MVAELSSCPPRSKEHANFGGESRTGLEGFPTEGARELGISVCIAILDSGGHLKAFHRMDGAWLGVIDVAIKKAKTSALFEMETQIMDNFSKVGADAHGIELSNENLITFAGGIPLRSVDGQIIGSIGVSGGKVAQDYAVAQSGESALKG